MASGWKATIEETMKAKLLSQELKDLLCFFAVDPETVCQFTGLIDSEGNEVWEGDILEGSNTGEICFDQGAFLIHSIYDNVLYSLFNYTTWDGKITCKVVGNKFDKISV